jgi:hypothetical protein
MWRMGVAGQHVPDFARVPGVPDYFASDFDLSTSVPFIIDLTFDWGLPPRRACCEPTAHAHRVVHEHGEPGHRKTRFVNTRASCPRY